MLKILLILLLLCLLAGFIGYRVLRFLTRLARTVAGIHEEGQRRAGDAFGRAPGSDRDPGFAHQEPGSAAWPGSRPGEKDITGRARILPATEEENPGPGR